LVAQNISDANPQKATRRGFMATPSQELQPPEIIMLYRSFATAILSIICTAIGPCKKPINGDFSVVIQTSHATATIACQTTTQEHTIYSAVKRSIYQLNKIRDNKKKISY